MSTRAVAYIKALTVCPNGEHIARSEKLVGMILGDNHQDRAHRRTYPSVDGMAEDAMMSERQFLRLLASLEAKGVIRREYPDGRGRGKTTFYFFPELDEKGCQNVTLSAVNNPAKRMTFSDQKGDRRVTSGAPHILSNKSNKDNKSTPPTPASGGSVQNAVDQVMQGCGFTRRRLRPVLQAQIEQECAKGESAATTALAMMAAWKDQLLNAELLRASYGPDKFFSLAFWRNRHAWHWDREKMNRESSANVGLYRASG